MLGNDYYMKKAIELAKMGSGFVNPDPLSGVVIVKEDRIIGESYYKQRGSISCEIDAIEHATYPLEGATMYLVIEPFYEESVLNKLLFLLKEKNIRKLYIGLVNANSNKTIDFIGEAKKIGIECILGPLEEECRELNEIYTHYIKYKTPFVFVKWAMTLDGKLATKTGDSKWISSNESLEFVHHLRQRVSAIMVGENTVRQDDPLLTTRLEGLAISNPLRVIVSKYGDISLDAKVLDVNEERKTLIITSEKLSRVKEEEFIKKGVRLEKRKEVNNRISFMDIMQLLGSLEIDSLYIEGGSSLLASAFESGCVHKVYTAIAPKIVGGRDAITPVGGNGIERMDDAIVLKKVSHEIIGNDVIIKGYI